MDSAGYLKRQGWQGDGHSLDKTGRGIKKPLLVSKKVDVLGVGLNKHAAVSDQWWLRAFDQGLKDLGSGKQSLLANVQKHGVNRGGLYGRFVKGDGMRGTIGSETPRTVDDMANGGELRSLAVAHAGTMEGVQTGEDVAGTSKKRKREESTQTDAKDVWPRAGPVADGRPGKEPNKYEREKAKREAKRAANQAAAGTSDTVGDTKEERKAKRAKKAAEKELKDAEKAAKRIEKLERKKLRRSEKAAPKQETRGPVYFGAKDSIANGADEIKLDPGRQRKLAAVGAVDRYSTKAEKKAKKAAATSGEHRNGPKEQDHADLSQASQHDMQLAQSHEDLAKGNATNSSVSQLSALKLAEYTQRAQERGVSLEEYTRRRQEKSAAKHEKRKEASEQAPNNEIEGAAGLAFVVDTTGDPSSRLAIRTNEKDSGSRACIAIANGTPFSLSDETCNILVTWEPGQPIPLNEKIWAGVPAKTLPKIVRKARRDWMARRREQKKAHGTASMNEAAGNRGKIKTRAQLKVDAREAFVHDILAASRRAVLQGDESGTAEVNGVPGVPLLKKPTPRGPFTKEEVKMARSSARRVLRERKREEERNKTDKKPKGKGRP
ncbi:hypothetical protein B0A50_00738 [Salinomyces thailandicus]|uniref:G-patch domain-containing protein n=1 Tax=Salinomyces thailandicus TaxID=706561 RepID=A0A4U0UFH2_9PEZI|nr:hypothetical protein B0A50_00738 [Salinomyces thailandica]